MNFFGRDSITEAWDVVATMLDTIAFEPNVESSRGGVGSRAKSKKIKS